MREARREYHAPESAHYPFVSLEVRLPEADLEAVRQRYGLRNWTAAVKEAVLRQGDRADDEGRGARHAWGRLGRGSGRDAPGSPP